MHQGILAPPRPEARFKAHPRNAFKNFALEKLRKQKIFQCKTSQDMFSKINKLKLNKIINPEQ